MFLGILPKGDKRKKIIPKENETVIKANKGKNKKNTYKGKENYKNYLNTKWWKKRRTEYYYNHKKICFCCGEQAKNLHHRTYSRLFKELDKDLIPLCSNCHTEVHKIVKSGKGKLKNAHHILKEMYYSLKSN